MASPTIRSSIGGSDSSSSQTKTVNYPATVNAGDLLCASFATGSADTLTFAAGENWTKLVDAVNSASIRLVWAYRVADGTEDGGTFVVTLGNINRRIGYAVYAVAGAEAPGTQAPEAATAVTGSSVNPDSGLVTPTGGAKDYLWFAAAAISANSTVTSDPTGYGTPVGGNTVSPSLWSSDKASNAASEDPGSWTLTVTGAWVATTVAVHPAAAAGSIVPTLTEFTTTTFLPLISGGAQASNHAAEVMKYNPAIYLKLAESSGNQAVDSSGNERHAIYSDGSGVGYSHGVPGLLVNDPSTAVTGHYVDVGPGDRTSVSISGLQFTGAVTLSGWIRVADHASHLLVSGGGATTFMYALETLADGRVRYQHYSAPGVARILQTSAPVITLGQIYHLTAVRAADGMTVTLFVNGAVVAGPTSVGAVAQSTASDGNFAHPRNTGEATFAHIAILGGQALTPPQVAALYATGSSLIAQEPTVTSVSPLTGAQGASNLILSVVGFGFVTGATVTFSDTGITVNSVVFVNNMTLTVDVSIDGAATLSARDLTVTNPDAQDDVLVFGFTVTEPGVAPPLEEPPAAQPPDITNYVRQVSVTKVLANVVQGQVQYGTSGLYTRSGPAAAGEILLFILPANKVRVLSDLSRIVASQFGVGATLALGYRGYMGSNGVTIAADDDAFGTALAVDVGPIDQALDLPTTGFADFDSKDGVTMTALIAGGNIEPGDTLQLHVVYVVLR